MKSIKEHPPQPEMTNPVHVPVLLQTTLNALKPSLGESYLDLTAGYGGHAEAFLDKTQNYSGSVLVDRDINAIRTLDRFASKGATLIHQDFVGASESLIGQGRQFDIILADLGVSSPQLDRAERGFSFRHEGPLDMRMDNRQERSAKDIVNSYSRNELYRIITKFGEENPGRAKRIIEAIFADRPFV